MSDENNQDKTSVKICGLRDAAMLDHALSCGAAHIGFVHFENSPRHVPLDTLRGLLRHLDGRARGWVVLASPAAELLETVIGLDPAPYGVQIHGGLPDNAGDLFGGVGGPCLMQAFSVASREDVTAVRYHDKTRMVLFDAKPRPDDRLPGGNGAAFDWDIMEALDETALAGRPWFLAGGLTPQNVAEAIRRSGARNVDVSSGVERAPGVKDPDKVAQFIRAAKSV